MAASTIGAADHSKPNYDPVADKVLVNMLQEIP